MNRRALIILIVVILVLIGILGGLGFSKYARSEESKEKVSLGNKYVQTGKYQEAILEFEKVIKIDKKNIPARIGLGNAYLSIKKYEEANKVLREAIDINSKRVDTYMQIAELYVQKNMVDEALLILKEGYQVTGDERLKNKIAELEGSLPITNIEVRVNQNEKYDLPAKVKIKVNNSEEEFGVKWDKAAADTSIVGSYVYNGVSEKYERKVKLTLTISPIEREVQMEKALKDKLDIFFSNFSEAYVAPFENGNISDDSLISFAIHHIWINNSGWVEMKEHNGYIKDSYIDTTTYRYFGKKVSVHKSVQGYPYENGCYRFPLASGEAYVFSQINKLYDLGNDFYKAEISIYVASSSFTGDIHGTMDQWMRTEGANPPSLDKKMTAKIKKVNEDGKERYILISYQNK